MLVAMSERLHYIIENWPQFIPFLATTGGRSKLNATRIIEALIIAAVAGAVSAWANQQVMLERMASLSKDIKRLETMVHEMRGDIYAPRLAPEEPPR